MDNDSPNRRVRRIPPTVPANVQFLAHQEETTTVATFRPIRTARISLEIVRQIQEAIFRGDFAPGSRLPTERELVQMFGVSKVSVREALRILETYGLVEVRPGATGGTFVSETTSRPISEAAYNMLQLEGFRPSELHYARVLFEPPVVALACRAASEDDLRALELSVERTRQLVASGEKTHPESQMFHSVITHASNNRVVELILSSLLDLIKLSGAIVPSTPEISRMVLADHEAILAAMRQRNAARARELMAEHLGRLAREFAELEERGIGGAQADEAW